MNEATGAYAETACDPLRKVPFWFGWVVSGPSAGDVSNLGNPSLLNCLYI